MPFKIGSFNLIPSFSIMTICIAGVGVVPYYARLLITGERSTVMDDFERYLEWKPSVWDRNAPYSATLDFQSDAEAEARDAAWRKWHIAAGNVAGESLDPKDPIAQRALE